MKQRIDAENSPDVYTEDIKQENSKLSIVEKELQNINNQKSTADQHAQSGECLFVFIKMSL